MRDLAATGFVLAFIFIYGVFTTALAYRILRNWIKARTSKRSTKSISPSAETSHVLEHTRHAA
jgi:hypothetical protein